MTFNTNDARRVSVNMFNPELEERLQEAKEKIIAECNNPSGKQFVYVNYTPQIADQFKERMKSLGFEVEFDGTYDQTTHKISW